MATQVTGLDTATPAGKTTWQIDSAHSLVEFGIKHMMFTTVKGRFTEVSGTIDADEGDIAKSTVQVEIDVASIDTRAEQRDAHLRSADFFDAQTYPTITFRSTRVEPVGEDHLKVVGDLTIRGITREVVLDTEINGRGTNPWGQEVVGLTAETKINRKDYGLTWNAPLEVGGFLVGDEVKVSLSVQAVAQ